MRRQVWRGRRQVWRARRTACRCHPSKLHRGHRHRHRQPCLALQRRMRALAERSAVRVASQGARRGRRTDKKGYLFLCRPPRRRPRGRLWLSSALCRHRNRRRHGRHRRRCRGPHRLPSPVRRRRPLPRPPRWRLHHQSLPHHQHPPPHQPLPHHQSAHPSSCAEPRSLRHSKGMMPSGPRLSLLR